MPFVHIRIADEDEAKYLWRSRSGEGFRVYRHESDHDDHEERASVCERIRGFEQSAYYPQRLSNLHRPSEVLYY